jgi:hypothetical protein
VSEFDDWPEWLNQACDALEAEYRASKGPVDIGRLMKAVARSPQDRCRLLMELAQIDLEWQWRKGWGRPRAVDYWSLAETELPLAARERIAQSELLSRTLWGDRPSIDDVAREFADERESVRRHLAQFVDGHWPLGVRVTKAGEQFWLGRFEGPLAVGRQRADEPDPPFASPGRLIVASSKFRRVSRVQWLLTRFRRDELVLDTTQATNVSHIGNQPVDPGQRIVIQLPCLLQLEPICVEIYQDW